MVSDSHSDQSLPIIYPSSHLARRRPSMSAPTTMHTPQPPSHAPAGTPAPPHLSTSYAPTYATDQHTAQHLYRRRSVRQHVSAASRPSVPMSVPRSGLRLLPSPLAASHRSDPWVPGVCLCRLHPSPSLLHALLSSLALSRSLAPLRVFACAGSTRPSLSLSAPLRSSAARGPDARPLRSSALSSHGRVRIRVRVRSRSRGLASNASPRPLVASPLRGLRSTALTPPSILPGWAHLFLACPRPWHGGGQARRLSLTCPRPWRGRRPARRR